MPKKTKRLLDVELEMHLDVQVSKRCECGPTEGGPKITFPEVQSLIEAAQKTPLKTKGTIVVQFAYTDVEVS